MWISEDYFKENLRKNNNIDTKMKIEIKLLE